MPHCHAWPGRTAPRLSHLNNVQLALPGDRGSVAEPQHEVLSVAPADAASVCPVRDRSWNRKPGMSTFARARANARRTALPPTGLPSRPTNTRSRPAELATVDPPTFEFRYLTIHPEAVYLKARPADALYPLRSKMHDAVVPVLGPTRFTEPAPNRAKFLPHVSIG